MKFKYSLLVVPLLLSGCAGNGASYEIPKEKKITQYSSGALCLGAGFALEAGKVVLSHKMIKTVADRRDISVDSCKIWFEQGRSNYEREEIDQMRESEKKAKRRKALKEFIQQPISPSGSPLLDGIIKGMQLGGTLL